MLIININICIYLFELINGNILEMFQTLTLNEDLIKEIILFCFIDYIFKVISISVLLISVAQAGICQSYTLQKVDN